MNPFIGCEFDPQTRIFYKYYSGAIYMEDLIASWEDIIEKGLIPPNTRKFILEYSNGFLVAGPEASTEIAAFYQKHHAIFGGSKVALIMQNPDQVIFPILVNQEQSHVQFKPFYTLEGALEWVNA
ncbi:hypothetical protein C900_02145 [Fulvivirga imtechensis AK7]|uniref:STAS/SEC14 domain-containing protein n=1 Tax=Fulvivirga imtechensis AK7 TaxID=1237149 RepID=L8JSF3_9BACT|nr:hypothetical protein [Fulvivirga imtechensis]ELR71906.1 hypothetical protein C900_02145 [Fulvivirga imtechensis AK7]